MEPRPRLRRDAEPTDLVARIQAGDAWGAIEHAATHPPDEAMLFDAVGRLRRLGYGPTADALLVAGSSPQVRRWLAPAPPLRDMAWRAAPIAGAVLLAIAGPVGFLLAAAPAAWAAAARSRTWRAIPADQRLVLRRWAGHQAGRRAPRSTLSAGLGLGLLLIVVALGLLTTEASPAGAGMLALLAVVLIAGAVGTDRLRRVAPHQEHQGLEHPEPLPQPAMHDPSCGAATDGGGPVPLAITRPRPVHAAVPVVLLGALGSLYLLAPPRSVEGLIIGIALVGLSVLAARRAWRAVLRLEADGLVDRRVLPTRRWAWDEVHEVRTVPEDDGRQRLEVVLSDGRVHRLWTGSLATLTPAAIAAVAEDRVQGGPPPSPLVAFAWTAAITVAATVATLASLVVPGALFSTGTASVDPADLPPGTRFYVLIDEQGATISSPRIHCPSLWAGRTTSAPDDCQPPTERAGTTLAIAAPTALAGWAAVVGLRRARSRRAARARAMGSAPPSRS